MLDDVSRGATGFDVAGACSTPCQAHGELRIPRKVARKLGLDDSLLVSSDAIWDRGGDLVLRTGPAGRHALKSYRGRRFKAKIELTGEFLSPDTGETVRSSRVQLTTKVR